MGPKLRPPSPSPSARPAGQPFEEGSSTPYRLVQDHRAVQNLLAADARPGSRGPVPGASAAPRPPRQIAVLSSQLSLQTLNEQSTASEISLKLLKIMTEDAVIDRLSQKSLENFEEEAEKTFLQANKVLDMLFSKTISNSNFFSMVAVVERKQKVRNKLLEKNFSDDKNYLPMNFKQVSSFSIKELSKEKVLKLNEGERREKIPGLLEKAAKANANYRLQIALHNENIKDWEKLDRYKSSGFCTTGVAMETQSLLITEIMAASTMMDENEIKNIFNNSGLSILPSKFNDLLQSLSDFISKLNQSMEHSFDLLNLGKFAGSLQAAFMDVADEIVMEMDALTEISSAAGETKSNEKISFLGRMSDGFVALVEAIDRYKQNLGMAEISANLYRQELALKPVGGEHAEAQPVEPPAVKSGPDKASKSKKTKSAKKTPSPSKTAPAAARSSNLPAATQETELVPLESGLYGFATKQEDGTAITTAGKVYEPFEGGYVPRDEVDSEVSEGSAEDIETPVSSSRSAERKLRKSQRDAQRLLKLDYSQDDGELIRRTIKEPPETMYNVVHDTHVLKWRKRAQTMMKLSEDLRRQGQEETADSLVARSHDITGKLKPWVGKSYFDLVVEHPRPKVGSWLALIDHQQASAGPPKVIGKTSHVDDWVIEIPLRTKNGPGPVAHLHCTSQQPPDLATFDPTQITKAHLKTRDQARLSTNNASAQNIYRAPFQLESRQRLWRAASASSQASMSASTSIQ